MSDSMNDEEKSLVPRLRFPEFREAGEWKENKMGKVLKESPCPITMNEEKEYSLVTVKRRYGGVVSRGILKGKSIKVKSQFSLEENDFLISKRQIVHCACGVVPKPLAGSIVSNEYSVLRAREGFDIFFLEHFSRQPIVSRSFLKCSIGIVIEKMLFKLNDWLKEKFLFPPIAEQQKIADCLSSLDALIAAQADKLDALKTHKKGLMQQLLPRESETVPRLRFPEFWEAGEWEEKTIADLKPFVTSGSRGWAAFYAKNGSLFVRITNLTRESIYLDLTDSKFVQLPREANEGVRTQLKEGDVLISITADIGIIGYVDVNILSPAYINQYIALVRFDLPDVCSKYVSYLLASDGAQNLFRASTDTGTKAGMSLIMVQKIKLVLPALPEQQKIADCLSSLDVLITAQADKLDALKIHKKGLMQQLFPSPEA